MKADLATLTLTLGDGRNEVSVCAPDRLVPSFGATGQGPALRHGDDVSANALTLRVVVEGHTGRLDGLELRLHPGASLLDAAALSNALLPPPAGWSGEVLADNYTGEAALVLRCAQAPLLDGSVYALEFGLAGLRSATDAWTASHLTVVALNFPGAPPPAGIDLSVRTTGLPAGPLQVAWAPQTRGEIVVTCDPARPVRNRLRLQLTNGNATRALVDPLEVVHGQPPSVHFLLRYADRAPGYGDLCTKAQVKRAKPRVALAEAQANVELAVHAVGDADAPYWSLPLCADNDTLLAAGASVVVEFDSVVSDLPLDAAGNPDPTELVVRWQHVRGLADGEVALPVVKVATPRIVNLHCEPALGTPIDFDTEVTISWSTQGAARSYLAGATEVQTHTNDGEEKPNTQVVKPRPGQNVFQVLAFDHTTSATPAAVGPAIVFNFNPPRIEYFRGAFNMLPGGLVLDLEWKACNAEYCLLAYQTPTEQDVASMQFLEAECQRIRPTPSAPLPPHYALFAVNGAASAKAMESTPRPKIGDWCAGGIIAFLNLDGVSGFVLSMRPLGACDWRSAFNQYENLVDSGYSDWHLPTLEQWQLITKNLYDAGLGEIANAWYWTMNYGAYAGTHVAWNPKPPQGYAQGPECVDTSVYPARAIRFF